MLRMIGRRMWQRNITTGTDQVLFGMSLPAKSRLNGINATIHVGGTFSQALKVEFATTYAVEGWILPVLDPDAAASLQTIWDTLVPKDTDSETMDLDTGAVDATPFWEPGEIDWTAVIPIGLKPERIFQRYRLLTASDGSILSFQENQSPFDVLWIPGETFAINIKKNYFVDQPSVVIFALALPSLDDTTAVEETALSEPRWGQVRYFKHVLERAMLHILGVIEAGAETPWEEATALLKAHLDPDVFEGQAGTMLSMDLQCMGRATLDHSVEGTLGDTTVTTGR